MITNLSKIVINYKLLCFKPIFYQFNWYTPVAKPLLNLIVNSFTSCHFFVSSINRSEFHSTYLMQHLSHCFCNEKEFVNIIRYFEESNSINEEFHPCFVILCLIAVTGRGGPLCPQEWHLSATPRISRLAAASCGVRTSKRKGHLGKFFIKSRALWIAGLIDLSKIIRIMDKIFVRGQV